MKCPANHMFVGEKRKIKWNYGPVMWWNEMSKLHSQAKNYFIGTHWSSWYIKREEINTITVTAMDCKGLKSSFFMYQNCPVSGLPCLASIDEMHLVLLQPDMPRLVDSHGWSFLLWGKRREPGGGEGRVRDWGREEGKMQFDKLKLTASQCIPTLTTIYPWNMSDSLGSGILPIGSFQHWDNFCPPFLSSTKNSSCPKN